MDKLLQKIKDWEDLFHLLCEDEKFRKEYFEEHPITDYEKKLLEYAKSIKREKRENTHNE